MLLRIFLLVSFAAAAPLLAGDDMIPRGTDLWRDSYDPPYEQPTELPKDKPLRKDLFDKLRPHVEKKAGGKKVLFEGSLRAFRNWAFFSGRTVGESGGSIGFPPLDNDDTVALWIRTVEGWRLVDFSVGHSDVFYEIWVEKFGMPPEFVFGR